MSLLNLLEEFIMFEKIRKMMNKKGFTLVELIVVLVILAILAALLIPALTGYIDKANEEKVTAECRMVVMGAQTVGTTFYADHSTLTDKNKPTVGEIAHYAEVAALGTVTADETNKTYTLDETKHTACFTVTYDASGKVKSVVYINGTYTCTYSNSAYTVKKEGKLANSSVAVG